MITEGHLEVFSKFSSHRVENKKKCFDENFIMDQCVYIDNGATMTTFKRFGTIAILCRESPCDIIDFLFFTKYIQS